MSRQDLVESYVSGHIDRRAFVRGLVALGISASAATAYATALNPTDASAQGQFDELYIPLGIIQCLRGGFRRFGFRSQIRCIIAVARGGGGGVPMSAASYGNGKRKGKGRGRKKK